MGRQAPAGFERASRKMFTRIIASLARTLSDEQVSVAQAAALHLIDQDGELPIGALVEQLGVSSSSATRLIDDLVQRGWVMRTESREDRRVRLVTLTKAGTAFIERAGADRVATILAAIDQVMPKSLSRLVFAAVSRKR